MSGSVSSPVINMKSLPAGMALLLTVTWIQASVQLGDTTTVVFVTSEEGRMVLTNRDDFVLRMSPFDRAARLKTDRDVSESEYLEFVSRNVLEWGEAERTRVTSALEGIQAGLEAFSVSLPKTVLLVKTTGNEEGGAAYTRANAIVFPESDLGRPVENLQRTIAHEFFHIMSRANPDLRERLYAVIGFMACDEVAFPPGLQPRKITNPDAPRNNHCVRLQVEGEEVWAIPILFSRAEKYDVSKGGPFFDFLEFQLLLVEREAGSSVRPVLDGREPKLLGIQEVSGFFEQVGRNTSYVLHPEEILAENFALLVLKQGDPPSPSVLAAIEQVISATKRTNADAAANQSRPVRLETGPTSSALGSPR